MLDVKFGVKDGEKLKKLFVIFLVLTSVLLMSNFASASSIKSQATITNSGSVANSPNSVSVMAPPSLFPTNATFETKAEVVGNDTVSSVGGSGTNYYAQSFRALSDYIVNGGLWIEHNYGMTPNFKLILCNSTDTDTPNILNPMFTTQFISNTTIDARPGRFYLNLTTPMRVQQNRTYWLVIDGYSDNETDGTGRSKWQSGDPYADGYFTFSNDAGVTWEDWYTDHDLDFIVNFSNRPTQVEVIGTSSVQPIGGTGTDYYAQSFRALDSYVVDAGIFIRNSTLATPDFRVQVWGTNSSGYPDSSNVIASSRVITGTEVNSTVGQRWFVHPNVSISVVAGETYWVVIDGYYDHTTPGSGSSRWVSNVYKDGYAMYSNDAGSSWTNASTLDFDFLVTFSAQQSAIKMMKGGGLWQTIGGTGGINYAGQSFKALNKYILDAGVWLENYTNLCPTVRLLLCQSTLSNASQPDVVTFLANSTQITGEEISNNHGMYYLKPTKPVEVVPGQTYFFIIDGWTLDNTTAGSVRTYDRSDNPYKDGAEIYSRNAGASWNYYLTSYDLGVDITFSDVPYEAQCGENMNVFQVGGSSGSDYYAQSFVALNDYIADAGVWIENYLAPTPSLRILLCGNDVDHPNVTDVIAMSMVIKGSTIDANPGLFYLKPTVPIPVEIGQTYWVVIDGYYNQTAGGQAQSRGVDFDAYPDGEFKYSNDVGGTWDTYTARDLEFEVIFTHVNQPPTQPDVAISPLKPFDSDDLTALWPIPSTDFEMEPVTYYIEWYKNGILQPSWSNNIVLPNSATLPTDDWMVKITPYDGHINGTANAYTVHVQADILTIDHSVTADSQTFHVFTTSNTSITGFTFNYTTQGALATINFTSTGPAGAKGFCNITIPKSLVTNPTDQWVIRINGNPPIDPYTVVSENATHTIIKLEYDTSSVPITIQGTYAVPEFTPTMLIVIFAVTTIAIAAVTKKINKRK
jgi:hypothetical protein